MKRLVFLLIVLFLSITSDAQKFLRYQMNNDTYNGFYTDCIESIVHDYKNGEPIVIVKTATKTHEIAVADIDGISIESARPVVGEDTQYRLYEFNTEGDLKTIYADNRATLIGSRNGDFGANDTILFSSVYNDISWLFYTNSEGRVKHFFNGSKLYYFDYDDDNSFTVLDVSTNQIIYSSNSKAYSAKELRAIPVHQVVKFLKDVFLDKNFLKCMDFVGGAALSQTNNIASDFARSFDDVANNPELHNQLFIIDGLSITADFAGIVASIATIPESAGWSAAGIIASAGSLLNNCIGLINHLLPPSSEQMQLYREYYQKKYSLSLKVATPENVTVDKAVIRGTFSAINGLNGKLRFCFSKLTDTDKVYYEPEIIPVTEQSYIVKASVENLKPRTCYVYTLYYECEVDGLNLTFDSDNIIDFTTPTPDATTIDTISVDTNSAVVKCSFTNVPEGATCGVQYGYDSENSSIVTTSASDGEKIIELTGLEMNTTYGYRAFIKFDDKYYYGETKAFTTDDAVLDVVGTWQGTQYLQTGKVYETFTLTLKSDGTAEIDEKGEGILNPGKANGTWTTTGNTVTVDIVYYSTATAWETKQLVGPVNDMDKPSRIEGTVYWGRGHIAGGHREYINTFVMSK